MLLVVSALVLAAPLLSLDPFGMDLDRTLAAPDGSRWLGTDALGRDVAARMLYGGRISLSVGLIAALCALGLGIPLGVWAGYRGGWPDRIISRLVEALLCFPALLLLIGLLAAMPAWLAAVPEVLRIGLVLGLTGWIPVARFMRGEVIRIRQAPMVEAARSLGLEDGRILRQYVLPHAMAPVRITGAFTVAGAIAGEAALSFLGLGVPPPTPTWGGLMAEALEQLGGAWWLVLFPGIALFVTVLGCNLVGEGIRDWLDPRKPV
jgi:peptide/nickel transport system permease protein